MLNRWASGHVGNDLLAFLNGMKFPGDLWRRRNGDPFALGDIEDAVVAEEWNLFHIPILLFLKYLPEDNWEGVLALFYAGVQGLDLFEGQPEWGLKSRCVQ